MRADTVLEGGDLEGYRVWKRVLLGLFIPAKQRNTSYPRVSSFAQPHTHMDFSPILCIISLVCTVISWILTLPLSTKRDCAAP